MARCRTSGSCSRRLLHAGRANVRSVTFLRLPFFELTENEDKRRGKVDRGLAAHVVVRPVLVKQIVGGPGGKRIVLGGSGQLARGKYAERRGSAGDRTRNRT